MRGPARWWSALARRERKTLRRAALVVLPAIGWAGVVRPVASSFAHIEARVAQERDLYRREAELLGRRSELEAVFRREGAALLEVAPRLFDGRDSVTAAAELIAYVTGHAAAHRVFVQASEPGAPALGLDGVLRIRVEVRAVSDLAGLVAWLGALEEGRKLVRVTQLSVIPAVLIGSSGVSGDAELLGLTVAVEGFALVLPDTVMVVAKGAGM
jgi:type II secretory pathway component PulM